MNGMQMPAVAGLCVMGHRQPLHGPPHRIDQQAENALKME
jgi:hypothetical protein